MKSLCKSSTMAIMIFVIMLISISFGFMANAMRESEILITMALLIVMMQYICCIIHFSGRTFIR